MMTKNQSDSNRVSTPFCRVNPLFLPCSTCGSQLRKLGAGKAPESSLLCECGKFIKWINASEVKAIASQLQGEVL